MSKNRDDILSKIISLRAKTEEEGASQNEMIAAVTRAEKMMEAYNVSEAELAIAEGSGRIKIDLTSKRTDNGVGAVRRHGDPYSHRGKKKHKIYNIGPTIFDFANVRSVYHRYDGTYSIFGHRPDVEFAEYLINFVRDTMDREYENFKERNGGGRGAMESFHIMQAIEIERKFQALIDARNETHEAQVQEDQKAIADGKMDTSTALVIKDATERKLEEANAAIDSWASETGTTLQQGGFSGGSISSSNAATAGREAGKRFHINKPIQNGSMPLQIGQS